jgi:hypothetical protein
MSKPWFGPKEYGFGLSPISPAGWVATLVYVIVLMSAAFILRQRGAATWIGLATTLGITVAFIGLTLLKSDRSAWKWRWGRRRP